MKTHSGYFTNLLGLALCLLPSVPSFGADRTPGDADTNGLTREALLPSAGGAAKSFAKTMHLHLRTAKGETETRDVSVVVLAENGAIWLGPAGAHCFVVGTQIVGGFPLPGGDLVFRRTTNTLDSARQVDGVRAVERKLPRYLRTLGVQQRGLHPNDVRVSLSDIVGLDALAGRDRSKPPEAVAILGVALDQEHILVTSKSGAGKTIDLVLDHQFTPTIALVDGVTVFQAQGLKRTP